MSFKTFEEISAWQEARKLSRLVRVFCKRAIERRDWMWAEQISRAALSIMANIAEGNDSSTNAVFSQFLGYSKRSAAEVRSHLYYGSDEGCVTAAEFDDAAGRTKRIGAQISVLMRYLKKHPRNERVVTSN